MLKKSTLLFWSVFLLVAFSISPVEAAKEKGPRCSDGVDNDGDGTADCGAALLDPNDPNGGFFMADPNCNCGGDGGNGGGEATFSVLISGAVEGQSFEPWLEFDGRNAIYFPGGGKLDQLDLEFFTDGGPFTTPRGTNCFGAGLLDLTSPSLIEMVGYINQGRGGRAEGEFDFRACTDEGLLVDPCGGTEQASCECINEVVYRLRMLGLFVAGEPWPPPEVGDTSLLTMTGWEIELNNHDNEFRSVACTGEGEFGALGPVFIDVERTQ